ncbi:hypothetical protein BGZ76_006725, partial [Entomortierella beljakovae]
EKGQYLLDKGDIQLKKMKIRDAIKYYDDARKYCPDVAQERLEKISPILLSKPDAALVPSTQGTGTSPENPKLAPQPFKLTGLYFPTLLTPSGYSNITTVLPTPLHQESANCTMQNAPSTLTLVNMYRRANDEDKKPINIIIDKIIQQFSECSNSKEFIQELTVLAAIPDQRIFIAIISQLLKIEKDSPTFPEMTIHGLAVILTSAPKEIDMKERQGLLTDILERLQYRLERTRIENNSEELLPLLRTISAL